MLTAFEIERIIVSVERATLAVESIAQSFAGINVSINKIATRYAPNPRQWREAVVTRIPTEEDKAKEAHGASNEPVREWFNLEDEEEEIGPREKKFIQERFAKSPEREGANRGSAQAAGSVTEGSGNSPADNSDVQAG